MADVFVQEGALPGSYIKALADVVDVLIELNKNGINEEKLNEDMEYLDLDPDTKSETFYKASIYVGAFMLFLALNPDVMEKAKQHGHI